MGGALWVFLWLWREGRPGESPYVRDVRGGGAFRLEEIAQGLGLPVRTVRRHLATLREAGYLTTWREQYGFTAVVSLWDPAGPEPQSRLAKNGHSEGDGPRLAKFGQSEMAERPKMATLEPESAAKFGQSEHPPGPPLKVLKNLRSLDAEIPEGSSSSSACGFNVTPTTKTANVVSLRSGQQAPSPAAVAAAERHHQLRQEQAILHHLGRIGEWERPELNRTLREILTAVPLGRLAEVFELAWLAYRFRGGAVRNPAGWWVETLRRTAKECLKAVAEDEAHGQE